MSFIIIALFLLIFSLYLLRKNKWASILAFIHLVSVLSGVLLDYRMIDSPTGIFYALLICVDLFLIIRPWGYLRIPNEVIYNYRNSTFESIIIIMGIFSFVFFLPVVFAVNSIDESVADFKYGGGMEYFYNSPAFPIPFKIFILITYIANLSIIALPLHYYYLINGNKWKAVLALIASLAYVLRGLAYFSRSVPLQYIMLYGMFFLFFYKLFSRKAKRTMLSIVLIGASLLIVNMVLITNDRFEEHYSINQTPYVQDKEKYISEPTMVSYIDYLSMGYYDAYDLLERYDGTTFKGQVTFKEVLVLLNQYLGLPFSSDELQSLREKLWPGMWAKTFNGYVGYVVYDFGIIGSFLITLLYFLIIKQMCSGSKKSLELSKLIWLTLLIQIPLHSIFYSALEGLVIPCIFFYVLNGLFVKRTKHKKQLGVNALNGFTSDK